MDAQTDRERALDSGGFGRLDISDLTDSVGENGRENVSLSPKSCDWCRDSHTGCKDYLVVADNRHYLVCPICWGRSATYVELRQIGIGHDAALSRLTAS